MKKYLKLLFIFSTLFLTACKINGGAENAGVSQIPQGETIKVVTTTNILADLVNQIGGDQVEVESLMGVGVDPHGYQATSSDVDKLSRADIAVYNGAHLEGKMGDIFDNLESLEKNTIVATDGLDDEDLLSLEDDSGAVDPHIWFSLSNWLKAAEEVANQLSKIDSDNEELYQANLQSYQSDLEKTDAYIRGRIEEVPEDSRYLVTAHDAFSYFGKEYGFEVVGLQGINTQGEIGTADVADLADLITEQKIKAIFIESSVPPKTIESLQAAVHNRGWDVEIGGELYSDSLGSIEDSAETLIKMYTQNIDIIVGALK